MGKDYHEIQRSWDVWDITCVVQRRGFLLWKLYCASEAYTVPSATKLKLTYSKQALVSING